MQGLAAVLGLAALFVAPGSAVESREDAAQAVATSWLKLVDQGPCEASWEEAAKPLRIAMSKEEWAKGCEDARQRLGKLVSRKVKSRRYTEQLPGLPQGQYVVIEYDSAFERKAPARETVTTMIDFDGAWRVSGYFAN